MGKFQGPSLVIEFTSNTGPRMTGGVGGWLFYFLADVVVRCFVG